MGLLNWLDKGLESIETNSPYQPLNAYIFFAFGYVYDGLGPRRPK